MYLQLVAANKTVENSPAGGIFIGPFACDTVRKLFRDYFVKKLSVGRYNIIDKIQFLSKDNLPKGRIAISWRNFEGFCKVLHENIYEN